MWILADKVAMRNSELERRYPSFVQLRLRLKAQTSEAAAPTSAAMAWMVSESTCIFWAPTMPMHNQFGYV